MLPSRNFRFSNTFQYASRNLNRWIQTNVDKKALAGGLMSDVHGTVHGKKSWRNKPLFRREGDKKFRNGVEASEMLYEEALRKDPYQSEFLQAVNSFLSTVSPVFDRYPKYAWIMKQLLEPERVIQFRVPWIDDTGNHRVNRGFRVQFSSSLGPYVGGLRFHPRTGHGTIKFLAFEQTFRNALLGNLGGAAGGSDFNPYDKSEAEIMRFCQSFMTELGNYIGPQTDIPGPGLGVGQKEIGYMFGQYKRIRQLHGFGPDGVVSGGKVWHEEATGYGVAHFANKLITENNGTLKGKRCAISGSGAVALHSAQKLIKLGAIPVAFSDFSGYIIEPEGFTQRNLETLMTVKSERNARIGAYIMHSTSARYHPVGEGSLWDVPCDYAFPCSTQNDITGPSLELLIKNGCSGIFEGAYMPCTTEAVQLIRSHNLLHAPSKVANIAPLLLTQLDAKYLSEEDLDAKVQQFIGEMYDLASETAKEYNVPGDLETGANIAGFLRVAAAMTRQGAV